MKYLLILAGILTMLSSARAQQTLTLTPSSGTETCGSPVGPNAGIACTAQVVGGGTFYIELGPGKHTVTLTSVGTNKLTASDTRATGTIMANNGTDRLHMDFSPKDASGNTFTGKCSLVLQQKDVNGVQYWTLASGTITIQ